MTATETASSTPTTAPEKPLVALGGVHLRFGANEVLKGIDLEVRRGEAVSIIGPSGSGKSTILRCITGLLRPQSGSSIWRRGTTAGIAHLFRFARAAVQSHLTRSLVT